MPDVITILTKDPKSVPTTTAWLAALALVTMLIESNFIEIADIAWLGFPIWVPGTPFYGQWYRALASLCTMGTLSFSTLISVYFIASTAIPYELAVGRAIFLWHMLLGTVGVLGVCAIGGVVPGRGYPDFYFPGAALAHYIETLHLCYAPDYVVSIMGVRHVKMKHVPLFHMGYGIFMDNRWINMGLLIGYAVGHFVHSNFKLFPWLENPYLALAAMAEEDNPRAPAAPRREAPAAAVDDPAATREEGPVALKVGDAVTFAFPDTSANAPLTGKRGVVEALPGGGDFPDRYVVFLAATADSGQRRLAVKREHLEFFARGL